MVVTMLDLVRWFGIDGIDLAPLTRWHCDRHSGPAPLKRWHCDRRSDLAPLKRWHCDHHSGLVSGGCVVRCANNCLSYGCLRMCFYLPWRKMFKYGLSS